MYTDEYLTKKNIVSTINREAVRKISIVIIIIL